jgi:hypothetical protein
MEQERQKQENKKYEITIQVNQRLGEGDGQRWALA